MYDLVKGNFRARNLMAEALNYPYIHAIGPQTGLAVALSEENYILAQTNNLHLATIDFSQFFRIGLGPVDIHLDAISAATRFQFAT